MNHNHQNLKEKGLKDFTLQVKNVEYMKVYE